MLNGSFFPTPKPVIDRMLAPLVAQPDIDDAIYRSHKYLPYKSILEPSAGKGDIADRLVEHYNVGVRQISCIEIEPELRMILHEKGYKVIDSDFLCYGERYVFDLILMNPPFDEGVQHLLKAWEVLYGGDIACLLNAETLRNPYTAERQLLCRLIEQHGRSEFIGQAFKDAERATDVEVVIVWMHKDAPASSVHFDAVGMDKDSKASEEAFSANPLAHPNIIKSLVDQYNGAADTLTQLHRLQGQYRFYTQAVIDSRHEERKAGETLNEKLDALKEAFWRYIFDKTKLGRQTTSNFQKKFDAFVRQTSAIAFTEANILRILEMFFLNRDNIMQECINEVFDKATAFHEKNVIHTEGWKTNKSWKVAPKIIIPWGISCDKDNWWSLSWGSNACDFYGDLDKALCYISKRQMDDIHSIRAALEVRINELNRARWQGGARHDVLFYSTFFEIRIFKKGTVHLTFRDKDLLEAFNRAAAEGKNWIGGGY